MTIQGVKASLVGRHSLGLRALCKVVTPDPEMPNFSQCTHEPQAMIQYHVHTLGVLHSEIDPSSQNEPAIYPHTHTHI